MAYETESQTGEAYDVLVQYLEEEIGPRLSRSGFENEIFPNPVDGGGPILVSCRIEDAAAETVLIYGHGDVVYGQAGQWAGGIEPFVLHESEDRYFGRGVADNKGQHLINIAALEAVIRERGYLGFNVKFLLEMSILHDSGVVEGARI